MLAKTDRDRSARAPMNPGFTNPGRWLVSAPSAGASTETRGLFAHVLPQATRLSGGLAPSPYHCC